MALTWDKALFDELYTATGWRYGVRLSSMTPRFHYQWCVQKFRLQTTLTSMLTLPGFAQVSDVAVIGGGFGWLSELLQAQGINVINVETSEYVLANVAVSEEADLRGYLTSQGFDPDNLHDQIRFMSPDDPNLELASGEIWQHWLHPSGGRSVITPASENISSNAGRNAIKRALSNNMDAIITEHLLDSMSTDAEVLSVCADVQALRPNPAVAVIHLVDDSDQGDPRLVSKTIEGWRALLDANGFTNHYVTSPSGRYL